MEEQKISTAQGLPETFKALDPETGGTIDVRMSSLRQVDEYAKEVREILAALEDASGIRGVFVTDRTSLHDFMLDDEEFAAMGKRLGIKLDPDTRCMLVATAKRLRKANGAPLPNSVEEKA